MTVYDEHPDGAPWGVYSIHYYMVCADGSLRRQQRYDRDLSKLQAYAAVSQLDPDELADALCESQPGGFRAYGSTDARDRYHDWMMK